MEKRYDVMVGYEPVSKMKNEFDLARDERGSLEVFRQSTKFKPISAPAFSKSDWHEAALHAAEIYLEQVGQGRFQTYDVRQEATTLFETLVEETGRRSQALARADFAKQQEAAVNEGHQVKKWLADMYRSTSPAKGNINLDFGSEFSLEDSDLESEGAKLAATVRIGGNLTESVVFSNAPEREGVQSEACDTCTQGVPRRPDSQPNAARKSPQWEAVLGGMQSGGAVLNKQNFRTSGISSRTSSDSMSDEAITERAAAWDDGVVTMVLKNSSRQTTPRTSDGSSRGSSQEIPRVSKHIKDALSSFQLAFLVCDAVDPKIPILYASAGFFHMTGYSAEEVIGRNCRFLQGVDTSPAEVARIRDALSKGEVYSGTILNYKKDGTPFWNLLTLSPIKDDQGKVIKYIGMQAEVNSGVVITDRINETVSETGCGSVVKDLQKPEWAAWKSAPSRVFPLPPLSREPHSTNRDSSPPTFSLPSRGGSIRLQRKPSFRLRVAAGKSRPMENPESPTGQGPLYTLTKGRTGSTESRRSKSGALTWQAAVRKSADERRSIDGDRAVPQEVPDMLPRAKGGVKNKTTGGKFGILQLLKKFDHRKVMDCQKVSVSSSSSSMSDSGSISEIDERPKTGAVANEPPREEHYCHICATMGERDVRLPSYTTMPSSISDSRPPSSISKYPGKHYTQIAPDSFDRRQFCIVQT